MARRLASSMFAAVLLFLTGLTLHAQSDGTDSGFSPYSVYGIGNLHGTGTAFNKSMGGTGIATRNRRFVNMLNPASVTARDSLSVMADFGLAGRQSVFSQGDARNTNTLFNIEDFVMSFQLWRHAAFMAGITPFSDMGYQMSYTEVDGYTGQRTYASRGSGSVNKFFVGGAMTFWNRLSIGLEYNFLFGNLNKEASVTFSDASYRSNVYGDTLQVSGHAFKAGLQYEQPLSTGASLTLGATYRLRAPMHGNASYYNLNERNEVTVSGQNVSFGDELGIGLAYRSQDVFSAEIDYIRSDWSGSGFDTVRGFSNNSATPFSCAVAQSVRGGFAFTPNRNDIRYYFKRCTYRGGAYFDQSYYQVGGRHVNTVGLTLGMTLPIPMGYNAVTIGLDMARRGFGTDLVKENYIGFNVGFNIFDIWFQKQQYK